jgi:hypothetical protein
MQGFSGPAWLLCAVCCLPGCSHACAGLINTCHAMSFSSCSISEHGKCEMHTANQHQPTVSNATPLTAHASAQAVHAALEEFSMRQANPLRRPLQVGGWLHLR